MLGTFASGHHGSHRILPVGEARQDNTRDIRTTYAEVTFLSI